MKEFRQILEAHIAGQTDLGSVERQLTLGLSRQPQLAAAHGAYVEALYRSGRIQGETYLKLIQVIRSFQQSMPHTAPPPSAAGGAAAGAAPAANDDRTRFRMPAASAQRPAPAADADADRTQFRAPRAPSAPRAPVTPPPVHERRGTTGTTGTTSGMRSTGSSWSDPSQWAADSEPLGPGSVIKERFVLEEEIGRGGMGIVFKARDLRKEEAQDRSPYVALKVLNEEFKRHPESLKALQRESRKAQQLAHPNIVSVFDFDRDGANVFMVMELLEGEALDRVIRRNEGVGVGVQEALRMTRDICRAMAYAHERGIVHSDFKPANAFRTREGVVKVFDFGIARAAKRADNVSGSVTLFDPGTLGALTPAYASCEMIEGLEPDPRDDVYAIACVAYELLCGRHPFDRMSAVQARDKGLKPKRPKGLTRRQWRALQRGLAFDREQRMPTAMQFLNELLPQQRRSAVSIGIAGVAVAGLAVIGAFLPDYLAKRRERMIADALASGDADRVDPVLDQLRSLSPERRAAILLDDAARTGLIRYFEGRIDAATDASRGPTSFPLARELLSQLQALLPDSLAVKDLEDHLIARENDEIKRQSDLFDEYLQRGLLVEAQGPQNIGAVLAVIRSIDPDNPLLRDPRLPGAFAQQIRKALQQSDTALAQALVTAGLAFDPGDATLADLRDQVAQAMSEQALLARRQSLESALQPLLDAPATLADVDTHREQIGELRSIEPQSAVLARIQELVQREVGRRSGELSQAGEHSEALQLVARYADLVSPTFVEQKRRELASAQGAAEARQAALAQLRTRIDALLQDHRADAAWSTELQSELRRLATYLPASDPYFVEVRERAAEGYIAQARTLRSAQRLAEAERMLSLAREFTPRSAQLQEESRLLAEARASREAAAKERDRLAQLEALKQKLLVQARANEVTEALASYRELRANLPADDAFLQTQAPHAIGSAYLRLASTAARDGRFDNAVSLTTRAREIAPELDGLNAARERYSRYASLNNSLMTASEIDVAAVRGELDRLARLDASEAAAVKRRLASNLASRIRATQDAALAARLTRAAQELFAGDPAIERIQETAEEPKQSAASETQASMQPSQADPSATPAAGSSGAAGGAGSAAASRPDGGQTRVAAIRKDQTLGEPQSGTARVPPDIPCTARLAGYGRRKQAVCYDTFDGGGRGPDLVVIPAGDGIAQPFAIGRTEISNADYALFCTRTQSCQPPAGPPERPLTGISIADAQRYLQWLSQVTGAVYRLPTDVEWTHAVRAQGQAADQGSINCLIEIGGKQVRGFSLDPVLSGGMNGWGLYNSLGNAQEWVRSGDALLARGGAYTDNISQCAPGTSRPHSGAPDAITGLRVVREME